MGGIVGHVLEHLRERFGLGGTQLRLRNNAFDRERIEERVPFRPQPVAVPSRVDEARTVGEHGQGGRLSPGQVGRAATKVAIRGCAQPHRVPAEGGVIRVEGEDLGLAPGGLQAQGEQGLPALFSERAGRIAPREPHHLHGDRTCAAHDAPATHVQADRTNHRDGIHARMAVEATVFVVAHGDGVPFRNAPCAGESPLLIGRHRGTQHLARRVHDQAGMRRIEAYHGEQEERAPQENPDDQAAPKDASHEPLLRSHPSGIADTVIHCPGTRATMSLAYIAPTVTAGR